jgi:hypothetical protein
LLGAGGRGQGFIQGYVLREGHDERESEVDGRTRHRDNTADAAAAGQDERQQDERAQDRRAEEANAE